MGCRQWQDLFLYLAFDAGKFIYGSLWLWRGVMGDFVDRLSSSRRYVWISCPVLEVAYDSCRPDFPFARYQGIPRFRRWGSAPDIGGFLWLGNGLGSLGGPAARLPLDRLQYHIAVGCRITRANEANG